MITLAMIMAAMIMVATMTIATIGDGDRRHVSIPPQLDFPHLTRPRRQPSIPFRLAGQAGIPQLSARAREMEKCGRRRGGIRHGSPRGGARSGTAGVVRVWYIDKRRPPRRRDRG
jgi:hypothetical protein